MPRINVLDVLLVAVLVLSVALASGCAPTSDPTTTPGAEHYLQQLDTLDVLAARPDRAGFERQCGRGHGCVFGPAWSDAVPLSENGHNGCDQASDQLVHDLDDVVIKPGTHGCTPLSGTLHDPYTGATIHYMRGQKPAAVSIDHIVPLRLVWDLGASSWDLQRRRDLAGDPRNLVAVSASANSAKGDSSPADRWKPRSDYRCTYAERFITVLYAYCLPVPARDKAALKTMLHSCK